MWATSWVTLLLAGARSRAWSPARGRTTVKAMVPESELYRYAATLRSMTQGRAHHSRALAGYQACTSRRGEEGGGGAERGGSRALGFIWAEPRSARAKGRS